ncbi:acetyl-coenzyme A synthetase N-terminal domain-containing protein, partial [Staphylococcus sp. SIMBA_130]
EGTLLWKPDKQRKKQSKLYKYIDWLKKEKGLYFDDYHALWEWSVHNLEAFWESQWEYFNIRSKQSYDAILTSREMPGTTWFPGAMINYTE